jgi:peptidoglycan/LPS O-acetylase OafA/YrhL
VALVLLLIGCGIVLFALPTKFGCNDGSAAFTTSKTAAYELCVGGVTAGVVKDRRVRDRGAAIAFVVFVDALLLRLASTPRAEDDPVEDSNRPRLTSMASKQQPGR